MGINNDLEMNNRPIPWQFSRMNILEDVTGQPINDLQFSDYTYKLDNDHLHLTQGSWCA